MPKLLLRIATVFALSLPISVYAVSDAELKQAAAAVNQRAPVMVDQDTRLDGATSGKQTLTYNYTLVNYSSADLDSAKFESAMRPSLLKAGCQALKPILSAGVTVNYIYKGKDAATVSNISLKPSDCGF